MAGGSGRGHQHPIPPVPPARKHCWVRGGPGAPGPHPGLIVSWEQREGRWFAQVVYLMADVMAEDDAFLDKQLAAVRSWLRRVEGAADRAGRPQCTEASAAAASGGSASRDR